MEGRIKEHPFFKKYLRIYKVNEKDFLKFQKEKEKNFKKLRINGNLFLLNKNNFLSNHFKKPFYLLILQTQKTEKINCDLLKKQFKDSFLTIKVPSEFKIDLFFEGKKLKPVINSIKMFLKVRKINSSISLKETKKISEKFLKKISSEYSFSRFHYDKNFKKEEINELFYKWLKKEKATKFLLNNKAILLLKIHKILNRKIGEILFIHVLKKYQGEGLGKKILLSGLNYLFKNNCSIIEVRLTEENKKAFYFYKKSGFKSFIKEKIYHLPRTFLPR